MQNALKPLAVLRFSLSTAKNQKSFFVIYSENFQLFTSYRLLLKGGEKSKSCSCDLVLLSTQEETHSLSTKKEKILQIQF